MTLPKSCEVADLAAWAHKMWAFDDRIMPEDTEMARAVRALLEAKCAEVLEAASDEHCYAMWVGKSHIDAIVSRVLGAS